VIIKVVEIYQEDYLSRYDNSIPRKNYSLRETYINADQIIYFREDPLTAKKLKNGLLQLELDTRQQFTELCFNDGKTQRNITIVGKTKDLAARLNKTGLLYG
jgi:hypothetical protein